MTIHYHVGDATEPDIDGRLAIVHVVSNTQAYNAGFAKAVGDRYPEARRRHQTATTHILGTVQWVGVGRSWKPTAAWWDRWVVNMVAQAGLATETNRHPLDLEALEQCLTHVATGREPTIVMPRIGCDPAGGTWAEVEPIVERTLKDCDVHVYDLAEPAKMAW